jgi:hypothetical protein
MKEQQKNDGSVLIIVVFVIAFMAALVLGIAQINTEEIQLMRNHIGMAKALAVAEAGLNDALAELRGDAGWTGPIDDEPFAGGTYDVTIEGTYPDPNIIATGTSSDGFIARVKAQVRVGAIGPPYTIRIDKYRINE